MSTTRGPVEASDRPWYVLALTLSPTPIPTEKPLLLTDAHSHIPDTFFTCIAPRPCPHLKQWVAKTVADNRERIQRTRMDYGEAAAATLAIALILAGLQRFVPVPY